MYLEGRGRSLTPLFPGKQCHRDCGARISAPSLTSSVALAKIPNLPPPPATPINRVSDSKVVTQFPHFYDVHNNNRL